MGNREYVSCAETAKLVRQALKESFPKQKFSVRSSVYSGGASINVKWLDGPNGKQVDAVLDSFEASYFDGMIDYKGSRYHKLDGQPVRFGADFVSGSREHSDAMVARAIKFLQAKYPGNHIEGTVEQFKGGKLYNVFPMGGEWAGPNNSLQCEINAVLAKMSNVAEAAKSATLARIEFAGDDGYGRGTVGRDGKGGESCYKAISAAQDQKAAAAKVEAEAKELVGKLVGAFEKGSLVLIPGGVQ